jgi:excisionase family DNA binding protein
VINGTIGTHDGIGTPAPSTGTDPQLGGLTVAEASVALGVSVNTIRRWIKEGRVRSERVVTPTGYAYRVFPDGVPVIGTHAGTGSGTDSDTKDASDQLGPGPSTTVALETQRAEAMAAYTRSLLEPLVQTIERLAGELREVEREVGELRAENRALVARTGAQTVEPTMGPVYGRLRVLTPWLLGLLAVVAAVGLLIVPR